jgi:hypothetical protein
LVGRVGCAQCLGVHSVRAGRSRLRTRMRTTMTILVALASPSSEGDCLRFTSPIAGTSNQSHSVREEAHHLMGLFLPGRIVRCKHNSARFATGAHHVGPPLLARSSFQQQPITLMSTLLKRSLSRRLPSFFPFFLFLVYSNTRCHMACC